MTLNNSPWSSGAFIMTYFCEFFMEMPLIFCQYQVQPAIYVFLYHMTATKLGE